MGNPGIDILDALREDYPILADLPASSFYIDPECPIHGEEDSFEISEDLARKSGLFAATTRAIVQVGEHSFSRYVKNRIRKNMATVTVAPAKKFLGIVIADSKVKEVVDSVYSDSFFDVKALLADWEKDGFPKKWRI